jgi:hypothetical protein
MAETKLCLACKESKPVEDFYLDKARGYSASYCKRCQRDMNKKYRKRLHDIVVDYLRVHPCIDCGETDPVVLEFDHIKGEKAKELARLINKGASKDIIYAEMEKTVVRCANDHRRKTAKQFGWWKHVHPGEEIATNEEARSEEV